MSIKAEDTASRLLDYYHCTFFLPLIGLDEKKFSPIAPRKKYKQDEDSIKIEAQAWRYFNPLLRNIMFDLEHNQNSESVQDRESVKEWELENIEHWELHLGEKDDRNNPRKYQVAKFISVKLYRYFNGIYLLAFQVKPAALLILEKQQKQFKKEFESAVKKDATQKGIQLSENDISKQIDKRLKQQGVPLFRGKPPKNLLEARDTTAELFEHHKMLELESWLHFTRLARVIHASFPEQEKEGKIALLQLFEDPNNPAAPSEGSSASARRILSQPGKEISSVIRQLLSKFFDSTKINRFLDDYINLYDDRLFVSAAYGVAGEALSDSKFDEVFQLALWVDRHEDILAGGYVYAPQEIQDRSQTKTLDLWEHLKGRYGFTEYSNVYLYRGSFFRDPIAPSHITQIYDRMLIQALFYQATLRDFDQKISQQTRGILDPDKKGRISTSELLQIKQQRRDFIQFTNCWWHHHLTEQMQGKEIFQLQQSALGLKDQYEIIKDELVRTDEHLQMEHEIKISRISDLIARWGFIIAIIATWYTALPVLVEYWKNDASGTFYSRVASLLPVSFDDPEYAGFFTLVTLPIVIFLGALLWQLVIDIFTGWKK